MFPLRRQTLPDSPEELGRAVESAMRETIDKSGSFVRVNGASVRELNTISVDLNGAAVSRLPAPISIPRRSDGEEIRVGQMVVDGTRMSVFGARADFSLNTNSVTMIAARDDAGAIVLMLRSAADGAVEFAISKAAVVQLLEKFGREEAARQGVTLESIDVNWRSRGVHAVDLDVRLRGRKFFMSAALQLSGSVSIDEQFAATLSNLRCTGDGAIASIVCGFVTPQMQKIENRKFTLSMLPLGELQLRDLTIDAADELRVRAKLGSRAS